MLNGTKTLPATYKRQPIGPRKALLAEASRNDRDQYKTDHPEPKGKEGDKKSPKKISELEMHSRMAKQAVSKLQARPTSAKPFNKKNQIPINQPNMPANKNIKARDEDDENTDYNANAGRPAPRPQASNKAPSQSNRLS